MNHIIYFHFLIWRQFCSLIFPNRVICYIKDATNQILDKFKIIAWLNKVSTAAQLPDRNGYIIPISWSLLFILYSSNLYVYTMVYFRYPILLWLEYSTKLFNWTCFGFVWVHDIFTFRMSAHRALIQIFSKLMNLDRAKKCSKFLKEFLLERPTFFLKFENQLVFQETNFFVFWPF